MRLQGDRRDNFRKKIAANNKSPEDKGQDVLDANVAWFIEKNLPINSTARTVL